MLRASSPTVTWLAWGKVGSHFDTGSLSSSLPRSTSCISRVHSIDSVMLPMRKCMSRVAGTRGYEVPNAPLATSLPCCQTPNMIALRAYLVLAAFTMARICWPRRSPLATQTWGAARVS